MLFIDIDETILDHKYAQRVGANSFLKEHRAEFPHTEDEFATLWHTLAQKYFDQYVNGYLTYDQQRRYRMKAIYQQIGVQLTDQQAEEKFALFLYHYENNWKAFEDVISFLQFWKDKCPLGIISNGHYDRQVRKLEKIGVLPYFSIVITSSMVGVAKPDRSIFLQACNEVNRKTEECCYIGDQLDTDAIGSFNAGMKGIWLNRSGSLAKVPKGIEMIHSLKEFQWLV